ncbi:hypothetical protein KEM52_005465 [Ascosphaera acerosa]|nr:hypothetical protein KEM52_005465 [Ascosphaera acerosa]
MAGVRTAVMADVPGVALPMTPGAMRYRVRASSPLKNVVTLDSSHEDSRQEGQMEGEREADEDHQYEQLHINGHGAHVGAQHDGAVGSPAFDARRRATRIPEGKVTLVPLNDEGDSSSDHTPKRARKSTRSQRRVPTPAAKAVTRDGNRNRSANHTPERDLASARPERRTRLGTPVPKAFFDGLPSDIDDEEASAVRQDSPLTRRAPSAGGAPMSDPFFDIAGEDAYASDDMPEAPSARDFDEDEAEPGDDIPLEDPFGLPDDIHQADIQPTPAAPPVRNVRRQHSSSPSPSPSPSRGPVALERRRSVRTALTPTKSQVYPTSAATGLDAGSAEGNENAGEDQQGYGLSASDGNGDGESTVGTSVGQSDRPVPDPTDIHREYDSIVEGEDFSMVSLDTLPSAKQRLNRSVARIRSRRAVASPHLTQSPRRLPRHAARSMLESPLPNSSIGYKVAPQAVDHEHAVTAGPHHVDGSAASPAPNSLLSRPPLRLLIDSGNGRRLFPDPQEQASTRLVPEQAELANGSSMDASLGNDASLHSSGRTQRSLLQRLVRVIRVGLALQTALINARTFTEARQTMDLLFQAYDGEVRWTLRTGLRFGVLMARRKRDEREKRLQQEATEQQRKEEEERLVQEALRRREERLRRQEEKRLEQEALQKQQAEATRAEEERLVKEAARLAEVEAEQRAEAERLEREERKAQEEADRLAQEAEEEQKMADRLAREEEEQQREADRLAREAEEERERERDRLAEEAETEARRQHEAASRAQQEEEQREAERVPRDGEARRASEVERQTRKEERELWLARLAEDEAERLREAHRIAADETMAARPSQQELASKPHRSRNEAQGRAEVSQHEHTVPRPRLRSLPQRAAQPQRRPPVRGMQGSVRTPAEMGEHSQLGRSRMGAAGKVHQHHGPEGQEQEQKQQHQRELERQREAKRRAIADRATVTARRLFHQQHPAEHPPPLQPLPRFRRRQVARKPGPDRKPRAASSEQIQGGSSAPSTSVPWLRRVMAATATWVPLLGKESSTSGTADDQSNRAKPPSRVVSTGIGLADLAAGLRMLLSLPDRGRAVAAEPATTSTVAPRAGPPAQQHQSPRLQPQDSLPRLPQLSRKALPTSGYFTDDHFSALRALYRFAKANSSAFPYVSTPPNERLLGQTVALANGAHKREVTKLHLAVVDRFREYLSEQSTKRGGTGAVGWSQGELLTYLLTIIIGAEIRRQRGKTVLPAHGGPRTRSHDRRT